MVCLSFQNQSRSNPPRGFNRYGNGIACRRSFVFLFRRHKAVAAVFAEAVVCTALFSAFRTNILVWVAWRSAFRTIVAIKLRAAFCAFHHFFLLMS